MKLKIVDPNQEFTAACELSFGKVGGDYEIITGNFQSVEKYDAVVSAANSFGWMTGGVDQALREYFGDDMMHNVQKYIENHYMGEQPLGTAFIINTGNDNHPYLVHAPTMRTPKRINDYFDVYNAMRAVLLVVKKHNKEAGFMQLMSRGPNGERIPVMEGNQPARTVIETLVVCGLGTGTGGVPPIIAAYMMALAYESYLNPIKAVGFEFDRIPHVMELNPPPSAEEFQREVRILEGVKEKLNLLRDMFAEGEAGQYYATDAIDKVNELIEDRKTGRIQISAEYFHKLKDANKKPAISDGL